ncbi:hypothetical protein KKC97_14075 [bacterium]|nr:hypothetical protein [bacterium]
MNPQLVGLLWWMLESPDSAIDGQDWSAFLRDIMDYLLPVWIVGVIISVLVYYLWAKRTHIYRSSDLFAPYTPIRALWLGVLPGLFMIVVFIIEYQTRFVMRVPVTFAIIIGIWTTLLVVAVSYGIACLPGPTPPKFRYRPWPKWLL